MRFGLLPLRLLNGREGDASLPDTSPPIGDISAELKRRIQMLYVAHVSEQGVDYEAMKASSEFAAYVKETARLPQLNVTTALQDDSQKIAFFVNLYNALTQHAVAAMGPPPRASLFRLFFGISVGYQVGPHRLSLNDIENGILRGNKGISILPRPFGRKDVRKDLCVQKVDPRIHFVLNCAANSCPPVLFLTTENLEDSLTLATKGFLSDDDNFRMEEGSVLLSRIFDWYRRDFAADGSERELLQFVAASGDEAQEKVQQLGEVLKTKSEQLSITWLSYDWSLNSSS